VEWLEDRLAPATLTVNSTADTANPTDSYLSLREAIAIVNSPTLPAGLSDQILAQIDGTLHDGGADTIAFDPTAVTGPIVLGGTRLRLSLPSTTAAVTIDGGDGVAVDGNNATGVFWVDRGVQVALDHLTITHGRARGPSAAGGGIENFGTLTVSNSTLSANSATGEYGVGGGIDNSGGTLTVSNSTFSANSATGIYGDGGGISSGGTLMVSNCTLSANSAGFDGGGIAAGGTVTVNNSTLSANSAYQGGGIESGGPMTVMVNNCTLYANSAGAGGGIFNFFGTLGLQNTLVAGNSGSEGPDIFGSVQSTSGYILVGIGGPNLRGISDGVNNNQVGSPANPINPTLSPLGYYGGPTRTFALLPGSPALGAGDPSNQETTDQRGLPRVVGGQTDIGAFQSQANPFLVTSLADPGQQFGQLSLREAINLAGALPGSSSVSFDPGLASGTLTLTAGELLLNHSVAITGPSGGVTVSGNNASRVFEVAAGLTVSLSGLTIANGLVSSTSVARGGGILNAGSLSLTDCTVSNNQVAVSLTGTGSEDVLAQGGGIASTGSLTLLRCTLSGNSATLSAGNLDYGQANGGGLYANGTMVTLTNSTIAGNSSVATFSGGSGLVYAYGGGLTSDNSTLNLSGCTISGNTATGGNSDGYGGGIHAYQSTVTLTICTIANNTAGSASGGGYGGGLSDLGGSFTLTSCTVSGNAAASTAGSGSGGGLYFDGSAGSFQLDNTIVAGNSAASNGADASGSFSSLGYNLIGITDGSSGWLGSDLTGTASSPLDPGLGTLSDNGGPTQTMALLDGSVARGAGDPALLGTADQRGVARTGAVDIGAFQATSG
jgi:CSLREA domain-containing protein